MNYPAPWLCSQRCPVCPWEPQPRHRHCEDETKYGSEGVGTWGGITEGGGGGGGGGLLCSPQPPLPEEFRDPSLDLVHLCRRLSTSVLGSSVHSGWGVGDAGAYRPLYPSVLRLPLGQCHAALVTEADTQGPQDQPCPLPWPVSPLFLHWGFHLLGRG